MLPQDTQHETCPLKIEDLYRYKWVSDPRISPDGSRVAYVQRKVKDDREGYDSNIWMADMGSGESEQFTAGGSDLHPRFCPDGRKLAFISSRGNSQQIWLMPVDGGEARQLTSFDGRINGFRWSPDGKRIAFSAVVTEQWLKNDGCAQEPDDEDDVRIITRMRYKMNGAGFTYDRFSHLFVIEPDCGDSEPVRVTDGKFNHRGLSWSPDSQYLATSARRCDEVDYAEHMDVYLFPADGSVTRGECSAVKVTDSDRVCTNPVIDPLGSHVIHAGHDNEFHGATIPTIACTNIGDGTTQDLLAEFPTGVGSAVGGDCRMGNRPGEPVWDQEAQEIYFTATESGRSNLYALDIDSRQVRAITDKDWVVLGFTYNHSTSQFALLIETATRPADIWISDRNGQMKQLTDANPWLDETVRTRPERFEFSGAKGDTVEGWLLPPVGESEEDSPLIVQIHGGPHSAYGYGFYHEFHILAGMGYGILYMNPHGSRGYGQEFNAATHHDWGGKDYQDLMLGLDYALRKWDFDDKRLGVAGGSFGGFMVNWTVGHTDRFSAAVTMRSTCNRYSMFGTSDIGFNHGKWEFPGHPWDNPMGYLDRSPISYAANVDTPVLIIHSENDLRCPVSQAEEWYTALKRLKKEVVFARFPEENHELSRSGKPTRRVRRLELIADWFERYA